MRLDPVGMALAQALPLSEHSTYARLATVLLLLNEAQLFRHKFLVEARICNFRFQFL